MSFARRLGVAAVVALLAPGAAAAHVRTDVVAVDVRAKVTSVPPPLRRAATVRVYPGDQALGLSVHPGHTVAVLGYLGEPFLRIGANGVEVDGASPTAASAGLLRGVHGRGWALRSHGRTVVWHDARVRALPRGIRRRAWSIPVVADGVRVRFAGEIRRVARPAAWPWLLLGAPFAVLVAAILRRPSSARPAAVVLGGVAAGATVATTLSFALSASAAAGRWLESAAELVFAAVGVAVAVRGSPDARAIAGGALGVVALSSALTKLPVFLHGVVLAVPPPTATRAVVAFTLWDGLAAAVVGLAVFFDLLERPDEFASRFG